MGQAAIDLPDPLQNHAKLGGPSADDLLAQLAGEEIDRLLAEADVERTVWPPENRPTHPPPSQQQNQVVDPPSPPGNSTQFAAPSAADPHTAAEATRDSRSQFDPPLAPPTPIAQADVEELDARISKELDTLFTELNSDERALAASAAPQAKPAAEKTATLIPPTDQPAAIASATLPPAQLPADPVAHATQLERNVMGKTLLDALGPTDAQSNATDKSSRFQILLRPLEWLNAPLNACSDALREALGKVAILTLVNALAILLYVIFLRKH